MVRIVIIDDEEIIRKGLRRVIEMSDNNYSVIGEASDGEEGEKLLWKLSPDIAIVDIKMPKKDGLSLIESSIKNENLKTRFIVLSAYVDFNYTRKAFKLGVVDYLLKPINRFELYRQLEDVVKKIEEERNISFEGIAELRKDYEHDLIEIAVEIMHLQYYTGLTLTSVAENIKLHPNYLGNLFKQKVGICFLEYLTNIRIQKAMELLANSNLKIFEISELVGYYSPKHFSKLFKKNTGVSPNQFRNKKKQIL